MSSSSETIVHGLEAVTFWGAQPYMYVNIVHFLLCVVVVIIYCRIPKKSKNLYNRAVLQHNISLLIVGGILTLLAFCQLSERPLNDLTVRLLWLTLAFFSNSTVFWLTVVSFDMTLMISRLCWISASERRDNEDRKIRIYAVVAYGGAFIPMITAAVFEFVPQIPSDHWLRANFTESSKGPRLIVNMYFFFLPGCALFGNNVLFVASTCNIVRIQRSTRLATDTNQSCVLRKKYAIFARLYVLMGAPWFFATVLACCNRLVLLKLCRTLQPVLWLVVLASRAKITRQLTNRLFGRDEANATGSNPTNATIAQRNDHKPQTIVDAFTAKNCLPLFYRKINL